MISRLLDCRDWLIAALHIELLEQLICLLAAIVAAVLLLGQNDARCVDTI